MGRRIRTAEELAESKRRRREQKRNWYRKYRAKHPEKIIQQEFLKKTMHANAAKLSAELGRSRNNVAHERTAAKFMNREITNTSSEVQSCFLSDADASTSPVNKASLREQGTGRRPSRRAAQIATEKIYNVNRKNLEIEDDLQNSYAVSQNTSKLPIASEPYQKQRQQLYHSIKLPPPNIDLVMECHEELLSAVQAEALLKAQLEYNMVMRTLRSLKANNVKIICSTVEDVPTLKSEFQNTVSSVNSNKSKSSINVTHVKSMNINIVPIELTAVVKSKPVE